jgi:hypothetical protein
MTGKDRRYSAAVQDLAGGVDQQFIGGLRQPFFPILLQIIV